jgi:hypothetical protein
MIVRVGTMSDVGEIVKVSAGNGEAQDSEGMDDSESRGNGEGVDEGVDDSQGSDDSRETEELKNQNELVMVTMKQFKILTRESSDLRQGQKMIMKMIMKQVEALTRELSDLRQGPKMTENGDCAQQLKQELEAKRERKTKEVLKTQLKNREAVGVK